MSADAERCPSCGRAFGSGSLLPSLPLGSVLALMGGLALVTAYFMPWFAVQGLLLSGSFLARFLSNPADVQRSCRAWSAIRASFNSFGR